MYDIYNLSTDRVGMHATLDGANLGVIWGNLIKLNAGSGRTWTTPPTFEITDPSIMPNDPLTNTPVAEIVPTTQSNALRINISAGSYYAESKTTSGSPGRGDRIWVKVTGAIS